MGRVVDGRSVHALGSDAVVPVGPGAAVSEFSTSGTIVVLRDIESRNPLRPAHRTGVDIYDAATGERCATATYDGSATGFGLTGCQAVVSVYGGSTYILRGETGT